MRALVVDDSRPVRSIIAKMMRSLHFETREVTNGREALSLLESDDAYDVVTINWQMPVMDGMEFVAAVRNHRRFRDLPLLMISSESDSDRVAMAMKAGVNQYIVKPCTERSIAAKLTLMGLMKDSVSSTTPSAPAESASSKIRVLLVDDSSVVRRVLTQNLSAASDIEVVGGARDGIEGLEMIERLSPDVVLLDVDMPRMDGLETLRQLRARNIHASVLMFSSRTERGAKTATDALLLGAKDFVFKPGGANMRDLTAGAKTILDEVIPRLRSLARRGPSLAAGSLRTDARPLTTRVDLVVIGASTGGPAALAELVTSGAFRENLSAPIVIAQHMPEIFTKHLASRLSLDSGLNVAEASDGESLKRGMIRIAPGGRHALITRCGMDFATVVNDRPPVNSCRPSADVLFASAAATARANVLAVVLTGMGRDGTDGCRQVREMGGQVVVQDESTSVVWGMPGSVAKAGLANQIVTIGEMGAEIAKHLRVGRTIGQR